MTDALQAGELLGDRYRLERRLGEGGMGVVWEATHLVTGRRVAVKLLRRRAEQRPEQARRLLREARTASAVDHPNVVDVIDAFEVDGTPAIVMELLEGQTLRLHLDAHAPVSVGEAARLLGPVIAAVSAAHALGIVHRDLKPENVFLLEDGAKVKVLDFGIAKWLDPSPEEASGTGITTEGVVLGTPLYMAPEQAFGEPDVDERADIWAIGVMLFEALAGFRPIEGTNRSRILKTLASVPLPSLGQAAPQVPDDLVALVDHMLERQPEGRLRHLAQAAAVLERHLGDASGDACAGSMANGASDTASRQARSGPRPRSSHPTPESESESEGRGRTPRRRAWVMLAGVLVVGAATVFAVSRFTAGPSPTPTPMPPTTTTTPLSAPSSTLACPVLAVAGGESPWLGAAAADVACLWSAWTLGGRFEASRSPAELLGAPQQPSSDFPVDLYDTPDVRERSLAAARQSDAWLDGCVEVGPRELVVELQLRAKDGTEVGRASGRSARLRNAVAEAVEGLTSKGALPRPERIDPEVTRFTSYRDIDYALAQEEFRVGRAVSKPACATLVAKRDTLEPLEWPGVVAMCRAHFPDISGEPPTAIDRSSVGAFFASAVWLAGERRVEPGPLVEEARAWRRRESSRFGRSVLAQAEAQLLLVAGKSEDAKTALLDALRDNARDADIWRELLQTAVTSATRRAASVWAPGDPHHPRLLAELEESPLEKRLSMARRAYLIDRTSPAACVSLGRLLLNAGREEEVRTLAAACTTDAASPVAGEYLVARVEMSAGRFGAALARLRASMRRPAEDGSLVLDGLTLSQAMMLARLLGTERELADDWVTHSSTRRLPPSPGSNELASVLSICMYASPELAERCFARIETLVAQDQWLEDRGVGARRFAAGDLRGAVAAWRRLATKFPYPLVALPIETFDKVGDPDLGHRLDQPILALRAYRGVSLAHPREAVRAWRRRDAARARALAKEVIDAWSTADVEVPAVATMRKILEEIDRSSRLGR